MQIKLSYLMACRKHVNPFHDFKHLRCVHIMEDHVFSSNGAAALFIQDSELKDICIAIPSIALDELEYRFKEKSLNKLDPADILISISSNEDESFLSYRDIQVKFIKEDPSLSILKADIKKPEVVTAFPFVSLELLKNFRESFSCLFGIAEMSSVALIPSGKTSLIYVDFSENIHGIIMPVKQSERDYLMKVLESHYRKRI